MITEEARFHHLQRRKFFYVHTNILLRFFFNLFTKQESAVVIVFSPFFPYHLFPNVYHLYILFAFNIDDLVFVCEMKCPTHYLGQSPVAVWYWRLKNVLCNHINTTDSVTTWNRYYNFGRIDVIKIHVAVSVSVVSTLISLLLLSLFWNLLRWNATERMSDPLGYTLNPLEKN